jgi:DNA polymerase-3 subunit epsilon
MQIKRWSLRLRIFLWFTFLVCCAVTIDELALVLGYQLHGSSEPLDGFIFAGVVSGLGILAVSIWVWKRFDNRMAKPVGSVSSALLASTRSTQESPVIDPNVRYLGDLGGAVHAVSQELSKTRKALAQVQVHEKLQLMDSTEKLADLAAHIPLGILLLSSNHKIALYNGPARAVCHADHEFGLGQALFDLFDAAPVVSAYDRLCMTDSDPNHTISISVHLKNGSAPLAARMRLMHDPQGPSDRPPYVLTFEHDTQNLALQKARSSLGQRALQQFSALGATLHLAQAARDHVSSSVDTKALDRALEKSLTQAATQAAVLNAELQNLGTSSISTRSVSGQDVCDITTARLNSLGIKLAASVPLPVALDVDSDRLIDLIVYVAQQLIRDGAKALSMLITPEDTGVLIALGWSGEVLYMDRLDTWLADPRKFGHPHTQGHTFLEELQTEIWPELGIGARRVLKLPIADTHTKPIPHETIYDFNVLANPEPRDGPRP